MKTFRRNTINLFALVLLASALPLKAFAAEAKSEEIVVTAAGEKEKKALAEKRAKTSDTAALLSDTPGVSLATGGGVSSLPVIDGLADDRLRIILDGMGLICSCPNHMNPPLSTLNPNQVGELKVYAGIAPVSLGGDSIGGTIIVSSPEPEFASAQQKSINKGDVGAFYRGNSHARGVNISATHASEKFSITYRGAYAEADNYKAADDFRSFTATGRPGRDIPKNEVGSTAYETWNHSVDMAWKNVDDLYEVKLGYQHIPCQLYPNQRMDMLDNKQQVINLHYQGKKGWGKLDARIYAENVDHYMDFGQDKQFVYGSAPYVVAPGMPMYTHGVTVGAALKADIDLSKRDLLRLGAETQLYRLDDWWPPSPADLTGMLFSSAHPDPAIAAGMSPNTFWNINDGKRDRFALFGEWEAKWSPRWTSLLGIRTELVNMDTGPVQGYNNVDPADPYYPSYLYMYYTGYLLSATDFNALDRKRTDINLDLTALARYTPDDSQTYEFGFARKTRTPNLYERYSWSRNSMALIMNNFVGDGNGYLGNPDLRPETAYTLSASLSWHNADKSRELKVTPYYTRVNDFIDAVQWDAKNNVPGTPVSNPPGKFGILKYANQDARLYGVDVSGRTPIGKNALGEWSLKGLLSYVNGRNLDTGSGLYNIMPLNAKIALQQKSSGWSNTLEVVGVDAKTNISEPRQELATPGYTLVNWSGSYTWKNIRFDFGVDNIFDKFYCLPLGGAYTGQGMTMSLNGIPYGIAVPGMGRSVYVGMNVKF
ncbi:MAG: TonB-dependent receptor [Chlorobiaceae bacterium]|nr:TonB-dependent receptor [Chlorobiaceae bacterium]